MASEILTVPEEHLRDVIKVVRTGLSHTKTVSKEVRDQLTKWCREEELYLNRGPDIEQG
jgi:hypothetical protein